VAHSAQGAKQHSNKKNKPAAEYMKKCRTRTRALVLASELLPSSAEATARVKKSAVFMPEQVELAQGTELEFVGFDAAGDVRAINPIDPERVITLAREAVELYNEAAGLWETLRTLFAKIGKFFRSILPGNKKDKNTPPQ